MAGGSGRSDDRPDKTDPLAATAAGPDSLEPDETARDSPGAKKRRPVHVGDTLGRYELVEDVGEGGMATVYRARDKELRREVAVKVLFPHLARRVEVVRRFQREARAAASLDHPNILRIFDVGDVGDAGDGESPPYIVMELVRGTSLLTEIEVRGPMFAEVVACIGALLADALVAAHAAGIIHRDIKPANVLVAQGGRILLADFGVARLETEDSLVTKTGALLGTPAYMSPEQAAGDTATAKSDLYSLGAMLYQLSTGALPYTGSPAKVLAQIAQGSRVPAVKKRAEVGPDLSRLIDRLMAVEAADRPAGAKEVAVELRAIAAAGGLGDAAEEVRAYFADQAAFVKAKTPTVVSAIVTAAQRAVADEKFPRAMALADRAVALAPDDPAVTALVTTVTEGGRAKHRRRQMLIGALGVLVAGGAAATGVAIVKHRGAVTIEDAQNAQLGEGHVAYTLDDAGRMIALDDAGRIALDDAGRRLALDDAGRIAYAIDDTGRMLALDDAGRMLALDDASRLNPIDDAGHAASSVDDAGLARADAGVARDANLSRGDARGRDAGGADAIAMTVMPDAFVAPADASIAIDAALADGAIIVTNDTWCDVVVDGKKLGRAGRTAYRVSAGAHKLTCDQPGIQHWDRDIDVPAGKTITLGGSMLGDVEVSFEVAATLDGTSFQPGDRTRKKVGYYKLEAGGHTKTLDLRTRCVVRNLPDLDCYQQK